MKTEESPDETDVFKPSDVVLSMPPLTACFGRSEREHAAACIVLYCQLHGDAWGPITPKQLGEMLLSEADNAPLKDWAANPFFRPDPRDLAERGYATIDEETGAVAFTPLGIERLRPWVQKEARDHG